MYVLRGNEMNLNELKHQNSDTQKLVANIASAIKQMNQQQSESTSNVWNCTTITKKNCEHKHKM